MSPKHPAGSRSDLEEHYRSLFRQLASSGQSLRSFARQRGLSEWTLYAWRRRLGLARACQPKASRLEDPPRRAPRLVEVDVLPQQGASPQAVMTLHLFDRHRVELPAGFDEAELRRIVRVLSSC